MVDQLPPARPVKPALSPASVMLRLAGIGAVVAVIAGTFFYVNGTFDSQRLRPKTLVNALEHNNGVHPGYRRNHAKGMCVIGYFESNGNAQPLSSAQVFQAGRTPVVGRFALPSGNPYAPDSSVPIRSLALRFTEANGQQWRTGMNSMPVFPVGTPEAFYAMLQAGARTQPQVSPSQRPCPRSLPPTRKQGPFCSGSKRQSRLPVSPPKPTTASMPSIWSMPPASARLCAGV